MERFLPNLDLLSLSSDTYLGRRNVYLKHLNECPFCGLGLFISKTEFDRKTGEPVSYWTIRSLCFDGLDLASKILSH